MGLVLDHSKGVCIGVDVRDAVEGEVECTATRGDGGNVFVDNGKYDVQNASKFTLVSVGNQINPTRTLGNIEFSANQSPFLAANHGNTGPASIPLLLTSGFSEQSSKLKRVMMCGFGVGLNWGVSIADLSNTKIYATTYLNE